MELRLQFFGGSGASGDLGGGGGGGGGAREEIPITRELHQAEEGDRKRGIEGFIEAVEDANDSDFNGIGDMLATMAIGKGMNPMTLAYYKLDGDGIVINNGALKNADKRYDATVSTKYHPPRGNKSGAFAIISHETGHAVTDACARNLGMTFDGYARNVLVRATRNMKAKTMSGFAGNISGYAQESNAECIAEAFADVRCNGSKAKAESQAIYTILVKDYKKKKK